MLWRPERRPFQCFPQGHGESEIDNENSGTREHRDPGAPALSEPPGASPWWLRRSLTVTTWRARRALVLLAWKRCPRAGGLSSSYDRGPSLRHLRCHGRQAPDRAGRESLPAARIRVRGGPASLRPHGPGAAGGSASLPHSSPGTARATVTGIAAHLAVLHAADLPFRGSDEIVDEKQQ